MALFYTYKKFGFVSYKSSKKGAFSGSKRKSFLDIAIMLAAMRVSLSLHK